MTANTRNNIVIACAGLLSALLLFGILLAIDRLFPGSDRWVQMGGATVALYGVVAYHLADDLKKLRALLVFFASLSVHCLGFGYLVHSGVKIGSVMWTLIILAEGAVLSGVMWYIGGAKSED